MIDRSEHLALGREGEQVAVRHLRRLGWRILERNWRPGGAEHGLELDIIARHRGNLIFVEVKTRRVAAGADPPRSGPLAAAAAFPHTKQARLVRAARHYMTEKNIWDAPCRFDLVHVQQSPDGRFNLEHHDNVIELGNIVDSGDTAWQPW